MEPIDNIIRFWILVSGCSMFLKFTLGALLIIQDQVSSIDPMKATIFRLPTQLVKKIYAALESKRLLDRSGNNLFLMVFVQIDKIIAVSGHPHQKMPIFFGGGLGFTQGFRIHYIKLDMVTVEIKIGAYQMGKVLHPVLVAEKIRKKPLVQQGAA